MQKSIPELITSNLIITILKPEESHFLATYERKNHAHLAKWESIRGTTYFTDAEVEKCVKLNFENFISGSSVSAIFQTSSMAYFKLVI